MTSVSVKTAAPDDFLWAFQMQPFSPCCPTKRNGDAQHIKLAKWLTDSYPLFQKHGTMFYEDKPMIQRPHSRINLSSGVTNFFCFLCYFLLNDKFKKKKRLFLAIES